jgi:hypothetical protein
VDARHLAAHSAALLTSVVFLAGCAGVLPPPSPEMAPWSTGAGVVIVTSAPDAGGPLSYRNCPTLAEARAAIPALAQGPDANAVPFKTMVLQCIYSMNEPDIQGRPAGVDILVFDASADGSGDHLWDSVRTDPGFSNPTDVPGLAEIAFATGTAGSHEMWIVQGRYGLHIYTPQGGIPLDQMVALARAMLAGLARAPR